MLYVLKIFKKYTTSFQNFRRNRISCGISDAGLFVNSMLVRRPSITQTDCSFILNILYIHKKGYSLNRSAMTVENSRQSFMTDDFRCWPYQDLSSGTRIRALHVSRSMFQYEPCIHAKSQLGVLTIILYWVKINHVCKQSLLKRLSIFLVL